MIRFEHITKKYKSKIVLNDISFEIEKGKEWAIKIANGLIFDVLILPY